ncbi:MULTISPECIES: peptidoglycan-binding domain-containing protein [unclassified Pseudovibrio]|uniref:peptidoglycan-binding domain-containing protein n=1 Tax=unclassified Pseudovibrio TaxID=2627060 RepID=UPI00187D1289|nr:MULTISPECIES: peptidoglycan-binding domain-containing protein [unclassified Pseudovibrio]
MTKLTSALCLSLAISTTAARAGSEDFIFGLGAGIIGSAIVNGAKKNAPAQTQKRTTRKRSSFSAETQDIQLRLNMLGFDVGTPDGVSGRRTRNAIRQFQISIGAYANGKLDNRQIAKLYELTTPQQPAAPTPVAASTPAPVAVVAPAPVIAAPVATAAPSQQINITIPVTPGTNTANNAQVVNVTPNVSSKNETQVAVTSSKRLALDPANLPSIHGLTVERFEHDVQGLLEKVGYQGCTVDETKTVCSLEKDTLSETVSVLTQDENIYGLQREVSFKNPAPRAAIMGKLLDAYPVLTHFENMTATQDKTCRITYVNNSGELLKQALEKPSNAEALRQLSDNCNDYHSLEVFGEDTVSGIRLVFYSSKPIKDAIENRKGAFQISSKPAQDLTF